MSSSSTKTIPPVSIALRPALIAIVISLGIAGMLLWGRFDGNITGFFRIGSELSLSPFLNPDKTFIFSGELGYDGQQFLTIALDPDLSEPGSIAALDHAAYRYRRILYPLLGYLLGLGSPVLIPWALVAINIVAIGACVGLVAWIWQTQNEQTGATVPFHVLNNSLWLLTIPGLWMVLTLSTADILASALGLGAVAWAQRQRWWGMALWLALGLLTRETLLILWVALLLTQGRRKRWRSLKAFGVSLLPLVAWLVWIEMRQLPGGAGRANFGWPLMGMVEKFQALFIQGFTSTNLYEAYLWGLLGLALILLFWGSWRSPLTGEFTAMARYSAGLYLGLLCVASFYILNYYLNYSRIFLDVFLLVFCLPSLPLTIRGIGIGLGAIASLAFLGLQS